MEKLRKHGSAPFTVAVIHGGPGAAGEMAPVARELSSITGILEPIQTAKTIEGQVHELRSILAENGVLPVTLFGFSWGAWLSFILAAQYPSFVRKLVLIGSGAFEEKYAADVMETRLNRLSEEERDEALSLMAALNGPSIEEKNGLMERLAKLLSRADSYDPLPHASEIIECQYDIYQSIWQEASRLRRSGSLLKMGARIQCPVLAIHGDYDPHPAEGVRVPLSRILRDFRFILLEKCGHYPWFERNAKERFYSILKSEI